MAEPHTHDDAEIARLLATENPEQYYDYAYGGEEEEEAGEDDDSDDPDYGSEGKKGKKKGKKKKAEEAAAAAAAAAPVLPFIPPVFPGVDPTAAAAAAAAAAAYGMAGVVAPAAAEGEVAGEAAAAAAQGEAAAPAAAAEGEAAAVDAANADAAATAAAAAAAAMPLAGLPGMIPGMPALTPEQIQAALMQQQAMLAMAASGQLTGMTPEQMAMMGLPFMGMPFMGATAPGVMPKGVSGGKGSSRDEDDEFTATGRRKRKDTGKTRAQSRSWTDDEERLFLEALQLYGRDWKRCAEHVGTRDHRAFTSHAQKHFIKLLLKGEELPDKVAESGRGYTLSGKPLDPNSAAARAYGLKPDLFHRICNTGKLIVGIHVTTTEMTDGPPPQIQRSGKSKTPSTGGGGGGGGGGKRQRRGKGAADYTSGQETEEEDEEAFLASVQQQAEVTDYVRNRPRRQVGRRTHLGDTTESTDLTELSEFVGPPGSGAANAQPFQVHIDKQALLVMDFHAHLSRCEIIGLLGGAFNAEQRVLEIREAYPCRRAEGQASGTSVELEAESQVEVAQLMEDRGQVVVGWYHSHPVFEARPSQKDNENQRNYQALYRDPSSNLEPWVGAIVGPYHQGLESPSSQVQLFVVRNINGELKPFNVRAVTTGEAELPTHNTELAIGMALDQLEEGAGRVDLSEQWRPYSRLRAQQPEGPPLTKIQKLRESLAAHLPAAQHPVEVAAFLDRVQQQIAQRWRVSLPAPPPVMPTLPGVLPGAAFPGAAFPAAAFPAALAVPPVGLQLPADPQQAAALAAQQAALAQQAAAGMLPMMGLPGMLGIPGAEAAMAVPGAEAMAVPGAEAAMAVPGAEAAMAVAGAEAAAAAVAEAAEVKQEGEQPKVEDGQQAATAVADPAAGQPGAADAYTA